MEDRDDLRAALCIAVAAGRIAAIGAAAVIAKSVPGWPILVGLACAVAMCVVRKPVFVWLLVAADLTLALTNAVDGTSGTPEHIAVGGAAAQAGAALGFAAYWRRCRPCWWLGGCRWPAY